MHAYPLDHQVVIVTGAAGCLGSAICRRLIEAGARVVAADVSAQALDGLAEGLPPDRLLRVPMDVTQASEHQRLVRLALEHFQAVHGLVANAGIEGQPKPLELYEQDSLQALFDVNVRGVLQGLQAVAPKMAAGGSVVLMSSIAGLHAAPRNIGYSASKHAVVGLMRTAAVELAARGIRVNSLHPGYVDSPMLRRIMSQHPDPAGVEQAFRSRTLLGRLIQPADIAAAVAFLLGQGAQMITGQTLVVDGGAFI